MKESGLIACMIIGYAQNKPTISYIIYSISKNEPSRMIARLFVLQTEIKGTISGYK